MRNRALHDALRDFALEAAAELTASVRGGAELSFDVVEEPGAGTVLYRYRALTSEFIGERWDVLRRLPACAAAARELSGGAELYLRLHGGPARDDSEPALRAMLERLYLDATGFEFPEERFERVYEELERALYENTLRTAIVAPVLGLTLECDRVDLGDGLFLASGDKLDAPVEAVWAADGGPPARDAGPNVLCVLRRDIEADGALPLADATRRFRSVISALRLLKAGGIALGPLAFGRIDESAWRPLPLAGAGLARGPGMSLAEEEEPELAELLALVRAPTAPPVGWALERFEMALERRRDAQALSDYLLALEGLFDARDETGRVSLPLRVAALCAETDARQLLRRRIERAYHLETALMGHARLDVELDGPETPRALVLELEACLRALIRDVLCGYLDVQLKAAADDILISSGEPVEIAAADLRERPEPGPEPEITAADLRERPEPGPEPEITAADLRERSDEGEALEEEREAAGPESELVPEAPAVDGRQAEIPGVRRGERAFERETEEFDVVARDDDVESGVIHSSEWDGEPVDGSNGWEDDPANWSAPV